MTKLDEKKATRWNNIKTSLKAKAKRLGHATAVTLGSDPAKGRIAVRIMADRLMKAWLAYDGATEQIDPDVTPEKVYQFLKSNHYDDYIEDPELRHIVGMPPGPPQPPAGQQQ